MRRPSVTRPVALLLGALTLAAGAGAAVAAGTSGTSTPVPSRTVTVSIANGTTGPSGPVGPSGPSGPAGPGGGFDCADGYEPGILVIDHPGGHVSIFTCLETP